MVELLSLFYSSLHLAAWHAHFPSTLERWMWRSSAIAIGVSPLLFWATIGMIRVERWVYPPAKKDRVGMRLFWVRKGLAVVLDVVGFVVMFVMVLMGGAYFFARGFVLVEAFASLRSPAKGTYDTVQWTNFIPHAG
ncbi:hypothetical protein AOQ84DRAFT_437409 [Glonium stellatum]|uniref:Uncharacterized protein n=1 Tax=Glonium stellatum TaxID=574774 RepID=A0A8E2F838_9PEZI|nr:hypothetical protein AOQ84DRAFT_437409 [Glonium stellatum]